MSDKIKKFITDWTGRGYEKGEAQTFWLQLLRDVLNISEPETLIKFEKSISSGFIDALIEDTNVIIEQKSFDVKLDDSVYQQAKRYDDSLPQPLKARWIVTCNFQEFQIYNMMTLEPPKKIFLTELNEKADQLEFLIDRNKIKLREQEALSVKAGKFVDKLYEALKSNYIKPHTDEKLKSLNKLCVRLVFCLYAESAGVFGKQKIFTEFLTKENDLRRGLRDLFKILNTPTDERDPYEELNKFPYVNGGLFDGEIEIPKITPATRDVLVNDLCNFKWKDISPTIFGAVFESTINSKFRRAGGMHYTSPANIHKIIDPLFMNELRAEFKKCRGKKSLLAFQEKLARIKIFDPACGSGNFLTESFLSLRRLENDVLRELYGVQIVIGALNNPVKVSIQQFFGIEIDDFACAVAKTALWISEIQMLEETAEIIHKELEPFPLKSYINIHEGNAIRADWWQIVSPAELTYIISNPPFVGHQWRTPDQVKDMQIAFHDLDKHGKLDYVCAWYNKAADFINGTQIRCAFVSTNSICQGESVSTLWQFLFKKIHIDFAYQTFVWDSESFDKAHVHCVIISFSQVEGLQKIIFDSEGKVHPAQNINGYLLDAPNIFIENRSKPPQNLPKMTKGSQPTDGGNLILTAAEREKLIAENPLAEKYIKPFIGAEEFINSKIRYCLWLVDCPPNELRNMPLVYGRLKKVAESRRKSATKSVREAAETPMLFTQIRQPNTNFLIIPRVSSERRKYIPIDFINKNFIVSDAVYVIPDATLFLFGILTSIAHMFWTKIICGRLGVDLRYSPAIYNNFPVREPTEKQRAKIESAAQNILEVRAKFPEATLSDLYDELTMPKILRDAHKENDRAVLAAYDFRADMTEAEIVAALMKMYEAATK